MIIVCIYFCGQFLNHRKVANVDENWKEHCDATVL
nr:MAG TPA: hypothetical protein [Caudoviricetes sp.]